MNEKLEQAIEEMRNFGKLLVPFNSAHDPEFENHIHPLKIREVEVDGYDVNLYLNRANYGEFSVETLQIIGTKAIFLPFCVVAKLGKMILGEHCLYLVELFRDNHKIYCWSVYLDSHGRPIPSTNQRHAERCIYDGFKYRYMYSSEVNFY